MISDQLSDNHKIYPIELMKKYLHMLYVISDITAPLYWWIKYDAYRIDAISNSCNTMHEIVEKECRLEDFSLEHLETIARFYDGDTKREYPYHPYMIIKEVIYCLNACRETYLRTKSKTDLWQMIQLLPMSYNQKYTALFTYQDLKHVYNKNKESELDECRDFCEWITTLPYSKLITD